jgi:hypothetical protein
MSSSLQPLTHTNYGFVSPARQNQKDTLTEYLKMTICMYLGARLTKEECLNSCKSFLKEGIDSLTDLLSPANQNALNELLQKFDKAALEVHLLQETAKTWHRQLKCYIYECVRDKWCHLQAQVFNTIMPSDQLENYDEEKILNWAKEWYRGVDCLATFAEFSNNSEEFIFALMKEMEAMYAALVYKGLLDKMKTLYKQLEVNPRTLTQSELGFVRVLLPNHPLVAEGKRILHAALVGHYTCRSLGDNEGKDLPLMFKNNLK